MLATTAIVQSSVLSGLELTFDDINNAPVANPLSVADWNTFFDLPTNGTPFSDVSVSGNTVKLYGGSGITLKYKLFDSNINLITVIDEAGCVVKAEDGAFAYCSNILEISLSELIDATFIDYDGWCGDCTSMTRLYVPKLSVLPICCFNWLSSLTDLTFDNTNATYISEYSFNQLTSYSNEINLPNVTVSSGTRGIFFNNITKILMPNIINIGDQYFAFNTNINEIDIRSCTSLGTTVGNDNVFNGITSKTITITVNSVLLTCNGGNMDGDLQYLVDNNDVTIIPVYPNALNLAFDDIANVPVANANSVSDWNTFFDLPTYGGEFTSVEVSGNQVSLFGGSNITIKTLLFYNNVNLKSVVDTLGSVVNVEYEAFLMDLLQNPILETVKLDGCLYMGSLVGSDYGDVFNGQKALKNVSVLNCLTFQLTSLAYCFALETLELNSCTNLGGTIGDDGVFGFDNDSKISGQNITLTVPSALMTCNSGSPDGDIQYLQANNTVTIITV